TYTVNLSVVDNAHGCTDNINKKMEILAPPVATVTGGISCAGAPDTLDATGLPGYTYLWQPAADLVDPTIEDPITVNLSQTTTFTVTVTDPIGCTSTYTTDVTVQQAPLQFNWD